VTPDIGIPDEAASVLVTQIRSLAAGTFALYFRAQVYHWNVTGPFAFPGLHDLFGAVYADAYGAVDGLAERIRALGELPFLRLDDVLMYSPLPVEPPEPDYVGMINDLVECLETLAKAARELFATADADGVLDEATATLAADRMAAFEKYAWQLRSLVPR